MKKTRFTKGRIQLILRLADEFGYFINSIDEMGVFNQLEEFLAMRSRLREIQDIINEDR